MIHLQGTQSVMVLSMIVMVLSMFVMVVTLTIGWGGDLSAYLLSSDHHTGASIS